MSSFTVPADSAGQRLDAWLVTQLSGVSRARIQWLLAQGGVLLNHAPAKASSRLRGGETVSVLGEAAPPPLRAVAENIPLHIVYEDQDLSVVDKPAGMMVHAGAGATESKRNRGTLVNALLHHYSQLSTRGGEMRPGIVHRLDKNTSGLILVARNDQAHLKLAGMFAARAVAKTYIALVHGALKQPRGTVNSPISRDMIRRTRMTTRPSEGGRTAISHYELVRALETPYGRFSLVQVRIETGRTHQIRVHMASLGHPVVGDTLYGAPARILPVVTEPAKRRQRRAAAEVAEPAGIALDRNFLHAAGLAFAHPRTGRLLEFTAPLPAELETFLSQLEAAPPSSASPPARPPA